MEDMRILKNKLDQVLEYNLRQDKMINDIHKIIHGNGNPEKGMIVKHARSDEKIKFNSNTLKLHWAMLSAIGLTTIGAVIKIAFF